MSQQDTIGGFVVEILANRHIASDRGGPNAREVLLAMEVQKLRNLLGAAVEVMPNSATKTAIESLGWAAAVPVEETPETYAGRSLREAGEIPEKAE